MFVCWLLYYFFLKRMKNIIVFVVFLFVLFVLFLKFIFIGIIEVKMWDVIFIGIVCGIFDEYFNIISLLVYDIILRLVGGVCYIFLIVLYFFVVRVIYI